MTTMTQAIPSDASMALNKPKRYHPALVALHWLTVILIFVTVFFALGGGEGGEGRRFGGGFTLFGIPLIGIHMLLGLTVLVLLVVRLVVRWRTQHPQWATTGNGLLDKLGGLTHAALYFFTFFITITGIILVLQGNRLLRTFGLAGAPTRSFNPGNFQPGQFPPPGGAGFEGGFGRGNFFLELGRFHGLGWAVLFLLILLHVGAALYHQFILKDNIFGRIWFGKQTE